jgi:hypothetical protein
MKIAYTKIVGVESDEGSVSIKFRPQGSDSGDKPVVLHISPHDTYIHLSMSNIGEKRIKSVEQGANIANVFYGEAPEIITSHKFDDVGKKIDRCFLCGGISSLHSR